MYLRRFFRGRPSVVSFTVCGMSQSSGAEHVCEVFIPRIDSIGYDENLHSSYSGGEGKECEEPEKCGVDKTRGIPFPRALGAHSRTMFAAKVLRPKPRCASDNPCQ